MISNFNMCLLSHLEAIDDRNIELIVRRIKPVLEWNYHLSLKLDGVDFFIIVNEKSRLLLNFLPDSVLVDRKDLIPFCKAELDLLKTAFDLIDLGSKKNYGLHFEYKCFERFFLGSALLNQKNGAGLFHVDCDLALSRETASKYYEYCASTDPSQRFVISPSELATYASCFNATSLRHFCDFILNVYLDKGYVNSGFRVCDMGALRTCLRSGQLSHVDVLADMDRSGLEPVALGFEPLAATLVNEILDLNIDMMKLNTLNEEQIVKICNDFRFYNFDHDVCKIIKNGRDAGFCHFHGVSKIFIPYTSLSR